MRSIKKLSSFFLISFLFALLLCRGEEIAEGQEKLSPEEVAKQEEKLKRIEEEKFNQYKQLGQVYMQKKEYGKAVEIYEKAVEMRPTDEEIRFNLASAYFQKGNDRAFEIFEEIVKEQGKFGSQTKQYLDFKGVDFLLSLHVSQDVYYGTNRKDLIPYSEIWKWEKDNLDIYLSSRRAQPFPGTARLLNEKKFEEVTPQEANISHLEDGRYMASLTNNFRASSLSGRRLANSFSAISNAPEKIGDISISRECKSLGNNRFRINIAIMAPKENIAINEIVVDLPGFEERGVDLSDISPPPERIEKWRIFFKQRGKGETIDFSMKRVFSFTVKLSPEISEYYPRVQVGEHRTSTDKVVTKSPVDYYSWTVPFVYDIYSSSPFKVNEVTSDTSRVYKLEEIIQ